MHSGMHTYLYACMHACILYIYACTHICMYACMHMIKGKKAADIT